jgi:hypothetical protein
LDISLAEFNNAETGGKPRSGVLSVVCGSGDARGPRSGYLFLVNRFRTLIGNRYAAQYLDPRKLPGGHRYAVTAAPQNVTAAEFYPSYFVCAAPN